MCFSISFRCFSSLCEYTKNTSTGLDTPLADSDLATTWDLLDFGDAPRLEVVVDAACNERNFFGKGGTSLPSMVETVEWMTDSTAARRNAARSWDNSSGNSRIAKLSVCWPS